ncbi:MAG: tetratricopeptide repeat protein [Crenarchaeota archaeon]|nr:MAG: tetratricopeptide repeat protein [Thermoproteota archaeon]
MNKELEKLGINLEELIEQALSKIERLFLSEQYKEAEIVAYQLLRVDGHNLKGLQLYGLILSKQRKFMKSIEVFNQAIELDEANAENHNNIALAYLNIGKFEEALQHADRAIELKVNNYNFLGNKGLILRASGQLDKSIQHFESLTKINPSANVWINLGSAYGQKKQIEDAIRSFQEAIKLEPQNYAAHVDLAYAYFFAKDWNNAWKEYEYRIPYWRSEKSSMRRFSPKYQPENAWDGIKSLKNKKIAVYCEQGVGDMIQFARFIPELKKMGANVIVDTSDELAPLFDIVSKEERFDYHCSVLSLPFLLDKKTPEHFMKSNSYIFPKGENRLEAYENFYKIGIAWAGNPAHPNDSKRSLLLKYFKQIEKLNRVKLFSFQKELGKRYHLTTNQEVDLTEDCDDMNIVDLSPYMKDFGDTVELLNKMDLIITVDTSLLHLAGAMGKKTYALIPFNPDWRWGLEGSDNDWYESVMLFRQQEPDNWAEVFDRISPRITF